MNIEGVKLLDLSVNRDCRGSLSTIYCRDDANIELPQWNLVRSDADVLRGLHVHLHYDEYYVPVSGEMFFGLVDLRRESPSFMNNLSFYWSGRDQVLMVPRGVLHGVYCRNNYILTYGLSSPFDGWGEFGCRFDDQEIDIEWPVREPILSNKDSHAGGFREMLQSFEKARSTSQQ